MKLYLQGALLGCALVLSGCNMMPRSTSVSQSDAHFLKQAAHSGHAEVESGRVAQQKASSEMVKSFAARMVQDHTRHNAELAKLAMSKGVDVPKEPSPAHKERIKELGKLEGPTFDRAYVEQMGVMAHENSVAMFQQASKNAQDPEVKAFAAKSLPVLQMHLDMAKQLQSSAGQGAGGR